MHKLVRLPPWTRGAVAAVAAGLLAVASTVFTYLLSSPVLALDVTLGAFAVVLGLLAQLRFGIIGLLMVLLISLPLGRVTLAELGTVTVSPLMIIIMMLVTFWSWEFLAGSRKIRASWMQLPLAILLLWSTISLYWTPDISLALKFVLVFTMGAAVYVIVSEAAHSEKEVRTIMWAVVGIMGVVGLYAVVAYIWGLSGVSDDLVESGSERFNRVEGIFTHPNFLGTFFALTIPPGIALAAAEEIRWKKMLTYSLVAAAIAGLTLTYSRGSWVGTGVGLLSLLLLPQRRFSLLLPLSLIGLLSLPFIGSFAVSGALLERLASFGSASADSGVIPRLQIWSAAPKLVVEHALLGIGPGNFGVAYGRLLGITPVPDSYQSLPDWYVYAANPPVQFFPHAHNLFLNLTIELGLVGLVAFMWLLTLAFLKAWRIRRSTTTKQEGFLSIGILGGFIAMLVANLVDTTFYQGFIIIVFFTFLGLLEAMERIDKS